MKISFFSGLSKAVALACCLFAASAFAADDVHDMSDEYVYPDDPEVLARLDKWQDQKFGVFFHWGLYSVRGINESWPLCPEERFDARRKKIAPHIDTYKDFCDWYWNQSTEFIPTEFNPEAWAELMKNAGMRYMVFTTKHHEGFSMYDTQYSDFSIAKGPFASDPRSNVAKEVFCAFRDKGFMTGAYYSKPDWYSNDYWIKDVEPTTRNINYSSAEDPERWNRYKTFVYNQINELMTEMGGNMDILWLDGGWTRKDKGEDLDIDGLVAMARESQPGLIAVDRTAKTKNENYRTPEGTIPEGQITTPWEACIQLGKGWAWRPEAEEQIKSSEKVISTLVEIVAKGGNYLLGVGPDNLGRIPESAASVLNEVGKWLDANGEAIYSTRPTPEFHQGNVWFTANKDKQTLYAIYVPEEGATEMPAEIAWNYNVPLAGSEIIRISDGSKLEHTINGTRTVVKLPENMPVGAFAAKFTIDPNAPVRPAAIVNESTGDTFANWKDAYNALVDNSETEQVLKLNESIEFDATINGATKTNLVIKGDTEKEITMTFTGKADKFAFNVTDNKHAVNFTLENVTLTADKDMTAVYANLNRFGALNLKNVTFSDINTEAAYVCLAAGTKDKTVNFENVKFINCVANGGVAPLQHTSAAVMTLSGDCDFSIFVGTQTLTAGNLTNKKPITVIVSEGRDRNKNVILGTTDVSKFKWAFEKTPDVLYDFKVNKNNLILGNEESSGIDDIYSEENDNVELYNLAGRKVSGEPAPGIYIRKTSKGVTKVVIR